MEQPPAPDSTQTNTSLIQPVFDYSLWSTLLIWWVPPFLLAGLVSFPCDMLSSLSDYGGNAAKISTHLLQTISVLSNLVIIGAMIQFSLALAWSGGNLLFRLGLYWAVIAGWALCWIGGCYSCPSVIDYFDLMPEFFAGPNPAGLLNVETRKLRQALAMLPMILCGVQLPFWGLRVFAGWRLMRQTGTAPTQQREPMALRDMFVGITYIAVMLGGLRFLEPGDGLALVGYLVLSAASLVVVSITVVPTAYVFLRPFPFWLSWMFALTLTLTFAGGFVLMMVEGDSVFILRFAVVPIVLYFLGLAAGLSLLRWHGWRLSVRGD